LFALCDGTRALALGAAQDFKRIGDGDIGPNTGGMGSYSPVPWLGDVEKLVETIHQPVLDELARRGTPFLGCLYAGTMITDDGPRVFEFNCRFGDPETQVLMPRLEGDLLPALAAAARGDLSRVDLTTADKAAVTVVLAAPDYPARSDYVGVPIEGVAEAERAGALVFQAGTARHGDNLVTNGGRILNVTGVGDSVSDAREAAYAAVQLISFAGVKYRKDIAAAVAHV